MILIVNKMLPQSALLSGKRHTYIVTTCNRILWFKGLVTNYGERGGLQNGRGWHVKFDPYKKGGGAEKVLAMLKGGGTKSLGVVLHSSLKF